MGFTPAQVGEMTMWQFNACLRGFNKSRGKDDLDRLSAGEVEDILRGSVH